VPVFLEKLMSMLETAPSSLICWGKDGSSFIVLNPVRFSKEVLPKFYNTSNFSSFVRQLNFYSFSKVVEEKKGSKKWEFVHKKFLRGRPELLPEIKRKTYQDDDSPKREEFDTLQREVTMLNKKVANLEGELAEIRSLLVSSMGGKSDAPQSPNKKRKRGKNIEPSQIDFVNLVDMNSDGLVTKAGEPMSTEDLANFLEDLEFDSVGSSAVKGESTSCATLSPSPSASVLHASMSMSPAAVRIKGEPGLVLIKDEPGRIKSESCGSVASLMEIDTANTVDLGMFRSFESAVLPLTMPTAVVPVAAAARVTTDQSIPLQLTQPAGAQSWELPQQPQPQPQSTGTCKLIKKGINLPPGVSDKDAQKILEVLALMMPQIQVTLLTQFQAAAAMTPAMPRNSLQRSAATAAGAQDCGA